MANEKSAAAFKTFTTPRHERIGTLPFVPAIRVRAGTDLVFVSGVLGSGEEMLPSGEPKPPGDIRIEAERVFTRIRDTLALAGADLSDVVRITKYMTDLDQHGAVVEVMRKHFGKHLPTSTTIEVRRLVPKGFGLEVDAIAAIPERRSPPV
jgi:2-iminobutanoate/2-iminopropanoate deaminase